MFNEILLKRAIPQVNRAYGTRDGKVANKPVLCIAARASGGCSCFLRAYWTSFFMKGGVDFTLMDGLRVSNISEPTSGTLRLREWFVGTHSSAARALLTAGEPFLLTPNIERLPLFACRKESLLLNHMVLALR